MGTRLELQVVLKELLGSDHVYFQPPQNLQMAYPCIVYRRDDISARYADNVRYKHMRKYEVTVIDANPDSELPDKVGELPLSAFNRSFAADNLNHDVFNLFF